MHICYLDLNLVNASGLAQSDYTMRLRKAITAKQGIPLEQVRIKMLSGGKPKLVWSNPK